MEQQNQQSQQYKIAGAVAGILGVALICFLCYDAGRDSGLATAQAKQEKAIQHVIDSLKKEQAKLEAARVGVQQNITNETNTIREKEREIVYNRNTVEKIPFSMLGSDLRTRLEAAQALKWNLDSALTAKSTAKP